MDQLNMNNIKHHEKINTHTQITKNNTIQRSGLLFFFSKRQYVRPCILSRQWYLLISSTDDDISDSVSYNETKSDSTTFKFPFASDNVGQLLNSRNVSETTEFFSHASQKFTFLT